MKTIYISGKISGLPMDEVRANFKKASEHILSLGHLPSNPLNNGLDETCSWEKHMRADISMLMKADAIYMIDNWQSSKGATIEHNLAKELGLEVIYDKNDLPIIYGIIRRENNFGVDAYALNENRQIIDNHFCSSEDFAKSDLGFVKPIISRIPIGRGQEAVHPTVHFNEKRHQKYKELYPDGYRMIWLGRDYKSILNEIQ